MSGLKPDDIVRHKLYYWLVHGIIHKTSMSGQSAYVQWPKEHNPQIAFTWSAYYRIDNLEKVDWQCT